MTTSTDDPSAPLEAVEARDEMRRSALELLVSLSEARPAMVKECHGWVNGLVRCCLEGMSEIRREGEVAEDINKAWAECDDVSWKCTFFCVKSKRKENE